MAGIKSRQWSVDVLYSRGHIRDVLERDVFAANVRRLREQRGMTQEQLADASGLHLDHVNKIENRLREPKVATISKLAKGLKLSVSGLFEGIDGV
jgi:transcriptional regulator with XRE-family HTH domain